jgi:hypothetical protein
MALRSLARAEYSDDEVNIALVGELDLSCLPDLLTLTSSAHLRRLILDLAEVTYGHWRHPRAGPTPAATSSQA